MENETDQVPATIEENHREEQPLAIREDAVPVRQFAAEKITDVLPAAAYERIGQLPALTKVQVDELDEVIPDDEVDIKPDGAVYASHEYYRRKLNKVFGPLQWTLIPGSPLMPRKDTSDNRKSEWYQRWILFVGGCYVSEAIASRTLWNDNANMSMDDVAEAIKSDALKRACKDLGLAKECWQKRWTEAWRKKYCVQVVVQTKDGNKNQWRRKDQDPLPREVTTQARGAAPQPQQAPAAAPVASAPAPKPPEAPKVAAPAKPVQVVPDAPKAAPAPAPAQPAATPKPANTPKLLDSQIRMAFARSRNAGLIVGEDAAPMMEWLTSTYGIAEVVSDGKKSTELCHAMIKMVPPAQFTAMIKKLDELAKGAKPDGEVAEPI